LERLAMSLLSANVIVCETVITEKSDVMSAIRIMNVLTIKTGNFARFNSVAFLISQPRDFERHNLKVQMVTMDGELVASAPDHLFVYGHKVDPDGVGAYTLTTEFNLDLEPLGKLGRYAIWVFLDGKNVTGTTLVLRRD
jgi:hypothetical protein